jgi:hypothetical protein
VLAALLLGPGVLSWALLAPRRRAVDLPLYAAAFWVIAFWWLRLLPLTWQWPVIVLGAATLLAGLLLARRWPDAASAGVWLTAAVLFAVLAQSALVAPGVDGAMHTAVARVLADAGGHPLGFRPLWPIDFFHSYPVGQPTLTALIASLSGLGFRQSGLAGHALAYALVLIAFASALSRWAGGSTSGLVAGVVAVLVGRSPLYFWTWGGAPNALGIAFGVAAIGAAVDAIADWRSSATCAIFAAASLLTHGTTAVAFTYALLPLIAVALWRSALFRTGAVRLGCAAAAALVLAAPYLFTMQSVLSAGEVDWVRETARRTTSWSLFARMLHDVPLIAGGVALPAVLARDRARALVPLAIAGGLVLLVLNGRFFLLPLSVALYPDRVAVLLLVPLAALAHDALAPRPRIAALCLAGLLGHAGVLQAKLVAAGREHALATEDDLRLLQSLPRCTILTNYGDAGQWIPALAGTAITRPQVNVLFFDEVNSRVHPCAAFRGEKRPYFIDTIPCPGPACRIERREGAAEIFNIVDPQFEVVLKPDR